MLGVIVGVVSAENNRDDPEVIDIDIYEDDDSIKITPTILERMRANIPLTVFIIFSIWLFGGILFYKYALNWTFYNSFFYCVNAGFSIGFGNINETNDDRIHAFTICYILCGSSLVSGSVGYFLAHLLKSENNLVDPNRYQFDGIPFVNENGTFTIQSVLQSLWYKFKYLIGWYSNRSMIKICIVFVIWMSLGVAYGMVFEGWTLITALFFAITSCSTAGLLVPPCLDPKTNGLATCDLGLNRAALSGTFAMVGVPGN